MVSTTSSVDRWEQEPSEQSDYASTVDTDNRTPDWRESNEQFVRGALIRGEAARATDGRLPAGATHEIIEESDEGVPTLRRRRFKIA